MRKLMLTPLILGLLAPMTVMGGHGHKEKQCAKKVDDCLNQMVTKLKSTGFIGVELDQASKDGPLTITKVVAGTPAEEAGLKEGDELVSLNGIPFNKESKEAMKEVKKPGQEVTCTIQRDGAKKKIKMTLAPMPADIMAKYIGEHMMTHAKKEVHASAK